MKKFIVIFLILFALQNLFAQPSFTDNYPFKIGNVFTFKYDSYGCCPPSSSIGYFKGIITKDTLINSKKYFFINNYSYYSNKWWRLDSLTGILFIYDSSSTCVGNFHEMKIDSLPASVGDSLGGCGRSSYVCNAIGSTTIFNSVKPTKSFRYSYFFVNSGSTSTRLYCKDFGLINTTSYGGRSPYNYGDSYSLVGCIINGILYGDTTVYAPPLPIDSESPKYFSINTGNKSFYISSDSLHSIQTTSIKKDSIVNSKKYYYNTYNNSWVRYDSTTRSIVKISAANCGGLSGIGKIDSLAARQNDTVKFCTGELPKICTKYADTVIFGSNVKIKTFIRTVNGKRLSETYAYDFSLVRFDVLDSLNNLITFSLRGITYFNGANFVQKGDTSSYYFDTTAAPVKNVTVAVNEDNVNITWLTPYERFVDKFEIEKYQQGEMNWIKIGEVYAIGKYINTANSYNIADKITKVGNYYYRIKLIYSNAPPKYFYADASEIVLNDFKLYQNYPNPFNGTSIIKFKLFQPGFVNLSVYNTVGKKELEIISEKMEAGYYSQKVSSDLLTSGVHYVRLKVFITVDNIFTDTKKLVVIK